MSEKIYTLLLRLYPSNFREAYGEEALQLFRDRARDETGFFLTFRLWLDLFTDLVFSLPREYGKVRRALFGISARQRLEGMPCFYVLDGESPRLGALLYGGILSLVIFGSIPVVIAHGGNYGAPRGWTGPPKHSVTARRAKPHEAAGAMMPAGGGGENLDA